MTIHQPISGMPTCVRQAWLALGGNTIQLDNPSGGWMCQSLDLGTPIMRTVMNNAPDQDGIIDRTQYMGARTVTAAITALTTAGARIDDVADNFAPYMVPSARPVLHYVLDRGTNPERTLTLRPDSYDWPIVGATQRDIALQWIAPNPIAFDPAQKSATALWGANSANINTAGDVPARPLVQVTGPLTNGQIVTTAFPSTGPPSFATYTIQLSTTLGAGQVLTLDCAAHTATLAGQSVLNQINWALTTGWPVLPVGPSYARFILQLGSGSTGATQATFLWNDGYIS
jgi:hypothetical protein